MDKNRKSLEDSLHELSAYSGSNKENLNRTVTIDAAPVELEETSTFEVVEELTKLGQRVDNKRQMLNKLYDEITKSINDEELTYVTIEPDYHNVSLPGGANTPSSKKLDDEIPTRNDDDDELWNLRRRPQPLALKLPVAQIAFQTTSPGSMLKHVHFETIPQDDDDDKKPTKHVPTTVKQNKTESPIQLTPSRSGTSHPPLNKTSPSPTSASKKPVQPSTPTAKAKTPTKSPGKTSKVVSVKSTSSTKTSPGTHVTTKTAVKLTYEEKRLKAVEEKARITKTLEILRIKIVRRKYAYIWLRRYYYSASFSSNKRLLLPSEADSYYRRRLLSESFSYWQKDSRMKRNEWRLTIKAVCHYNYVILNKLWKAWQLFTIEHQLETNLERRAVNHYNLKLKETMLSQWKQMRYELIKRRANLEAAQKNRDLELAKFCFNHWQMRFHDSKLDGQYYRAACRHHELFQLEQCFKKWSFKFKNEMEIRKQDRLAHNHYRKNLLAKCFGSLKVYAAYRRKKNAQKDKINEYAESQLVYKVFHTWLRKYSALKQYQEMDVHIQEFKERYLKARIFQLWQNQLRRNAALNLKSIKMQRYYERSLKRKVFEAIRANHLEIQAEKSDERRADDFAVRWIKRHFLNQWMDKYEYKVDIKSMHLAYKAKLHYEARICRKSLSIWIEFHKEQLILNGKCKRADELHEKHLARRYFDKICLYTSLTKYKRENHKIATETYEHNTISKYFSFWCYKYELSLETQMNTRIAILHYESKLKAVTYQKWSKKLEMTLTEEAKEQKALVHHHQSLMSQMMKTWIKSWRDVKFEMSIEQQALQHDLKRRCLPIFLRWKTHIIESQNLEKRCQDALNRYEIRLKQNVFSAWLKQTKEFKSINSFVDHQFQQKQREKCADMLSNWRMHVVYKKREKSKEQLAMTFYLKHLMVRIVREWRSYTSTRALKRHIEEARLEEFARIQRKLVIGQVFDIWKSRALSLLELDRKNQLALTVERQNLQRKAFIAWRLYVRKCRHQHLLERQAQWFLEMRIKRQCYNLWSNKYLDALELADKNARALLFWSINIQKTCFSGWFEWYRIKKTKERRYKEAMQKRQCDIMKNCARHFIVYAMDSKQRRLKSNAYLKEKIWTNESELELKYFYIWLGKCKTKMTKRFISEVEPEENRPPQPKKPGKKPPSIVVQPSLEKRESVMDINYSSGFVELKTRSRPAPRKPSFIIDSVDVGAPPIITPVEQEVNKTPREVAQKEPEPVMHAVLPKQTPIQQAMAPSESTSSLLLPPTAFMSTISDIDVQDGISPRQSTQPFTTNQELRIPLLSLMSARSQASSVTTIAPAELQAELNYARIEESHAASRKQGLLISLSPKTRSNLKQISPSGLSMMSELTTSRQPPSTAASTARRDQTDASSGLIELKKRLEKLNINSEKLKRLKEQERLINSVADSTEANNISIIGPIFVERDQIRAEIEELSKNLKTEKKKIYELMRKYGINPKS